MNLYLKYTMLLCVVFLSQHMLTAQRIYEPYNITDHTNKVLGFLKVYYNDSITPAKGYKVVCRTFVGVRHGPFPVFSKPNYFDVELTIKDTTLKGDVYMEWQERQEVFSATKNELETKLVLEKKWFFDGNSRKKIIIRNIHYPVSGFDNKGRGFRVVAIFIPAQKSKKPEILLKEFGLAR